MHDVFVAGFEVDLVDKACAGQGKKTSTRDERITPVRQALSKSADIEKGY